MDSNSNIRSLVMNYKILSHNLAKKTFEVNTMNNIRSLKELVLEDLRKNGVKFTPDIELNFGIATIDYAEQFLFFISEHKPISTIFNSFNNNSGVSGVMFAYKSRMDFNELPVEVKKKKDINCKKKQLLLVESISRNKMKDVKKLLMQNMDPNFTISTSKYTPLYVWIIMKPVFQEACLDLLIENGAHLDFRVPPGITVVHAAILGEFLSALQFLYCRGASLEEWDKDGIPAFFYSINNDIHMRCLEFLLELNPNLTMKDSSSNNIIHYCIKKGLANHLNVVFKYLSQHSQHSLVYDLLTSFNNSGNPPIHMCVIQAEKSCLELLCRIKENFTIRNRSNETALELASRIGEPAVLAMLNQAIKSGFVGKFRINDSYSYETLFNNCRQYARTLTLRNKTKKKNVSYPTMFQVALGHSATSSEELALFETETILVYLALNSNIGFGYKTVNEISIYGWFPLACIKMTSKSKRAEFQKNVGTFEALINTIPKLPPQISCSFIPILILMEVPAKVSSIGMEIAMKVEMNESREISFNVSKLYIRNIIADSPADLAGIRVGDQILYIMSNDVTCATLKQAANIIYTEIIPQKEKSRQIYFVVVRQSEISLTQLSKFAFQDPNKTSETKPENTETTSDKTTEPTDKTTEPTDKTTDPTDKTTDPTDKTTYPTDYTTDLTDNRNDENKSPVHENIVI